MNHARKRARQIEARMARRPIEPVVCKMRTDGEPLSCRQCGYHVCSCAPAAPRSAHTEPLLRATLGDLVNRYRYFAPASYRLEPIDVPPLPQHEAEALFMQRFEQMRRSRELEAKHAESVAKHKRTVAQMSRAHDLQAVNDPDLSRFVWPKP